MRFSFFKIFGIFIYLLIATHVIAIDIPQTSFLKNYTKRDYNARTQNWDAVQDDNNIMYFANNEGVLSFNGINWDKVQMPNKSIVRSLLCLGGDTILAGAYSEFGAIFHDNSGNLVYESWVNIIPEQFRNFNEIWHIHKLGKYVIIQSFSHIVIIEDKKFVKAILPENGFMFSFLIDSTLYVQQQKNGLFKLSNLNLELVSNHQVFKNKEVWALLPLDEGRLLVGTQFDGLFVFDGVNCTDWENETNDFIKKNNLFSATLMANGKYAFGSIQNGLIITNKQGEILSYENSEVGLQNNTVLCVFEDNAHNLWLGLDNGIDYIKSNSPLSYVRKKGGFGTGYASMIYDNKLYAGTNQGLYYMPLHKAYENFVNPTDFEIIEVTRGQVWSLRSFNNMLFICHNLGLFIIKNGSIIKINNLQGVWDIAQIPNELNLLLLGTYDGFFTLNTNTLELIKLNGFSESARRFQFYNNNCLLLSHGYKGIFDIKINIESYTAELLNYFDGSNSLPRKEGNDVFRFNNNVVVTTDSGVYNYNDNQLTYSQFWNDVFERDPNRISNIIDAGNMMYWCFKDGKASLLTYLNDKMYEINYRDFLSISNSFPTSYENVLQTDLSSYLIGTEEGFVQYEHRVSTDVKEKILIDVASVQYKPRGEINYIKLDFSKNANGSKIDELPYKNRRLKIVLSIPYFSDQNLVQFRYRINKGQWCQWISGNELKLDDLREGNFNIDIQCSIDGKNISGETKLSFIIDPPFFRGWYSIMFYLAIIIGGLYVISVLIKKRIENEKRREALKQQKQMIEMQIKLEREAELAQTELLSLKNERLSSDVRHKSKELANTTMSLIHKNKLLLQFIDILTDLKKDDVKYRENTKINNLIKRINKEIENEDNYAVFEENFDKVHENFLQRLKVKHPDLTPKDLRLAAYLRMNLSSKEIAPLLNISIRSVEISRYRLRKKMELGHDSNLTEYIIST